LQAAGGARAHLWSILLATAILPLLVAFGLTVVLRLGESGRSPRAGLVVPLPAGQERPA
jgi:hypothetical protein